MGLVGSGRSGAALGQSGTGSAAFQMDSASLETREELRSRGVCSLAVNVPSMLPTGWRSHSVRLIVSRYAALVGSSMKRIWSKGRGKRGFARMGFLAVLGRARSARPTLHDLRPGWAGRSARGLSQPEANLTRQMAPLTSQTPTGRNALGYGDWGVSSRSPTRCSAGDLARCRPNG